MADTMAPDGWDSDPRWLRQWPLVAETVVLDFRDNGPSWPTLWPPMSDTMSPHGWHCGPWYLRQWPLLAETMAETVSGPWWLTHWPLMAVKISPADNQVNIVRLECECLKWIPFGSESVFSDVNTTMNSSFSWKEVNLAIWLKLLLLFGSTPFECCPDMVCPT